MRSFFVSGWLKQSPLLFPLLEFVQRLTPPQLHLQLKHFQGQVHVENLQHGMVGVKVIHQLPIRERENLFRIKCEWKSIWEWGFCSSFAHSAWLFWACSWELPETTATNLVVGRMMVATYGAWPGWWIMFILFTIHFWATSSLTQASLATGVFLPVFFLGSQVEGSCTGCTADKNDTRRY